MTSKGFRRQKNPEDQREAMDSAMFLLKFRGRSESELGQRLQRKGFSAGTVERTVNRLRELKLLDDESLARQWVESRRRSGQGEFRIRQTLRQRGIPRSLADEVIRSGSEKGDEVARAWKVLTRREKSVKSADFRSQYRRLGGFLARRGFSADVVHEVLEKYFSHKREVDQ